ncbi:MULTISPECIES: helix-turn-helix domain-containing protein [Halorussus]|uniref:helix-turn-helix domain-containing protein n=1 Tax=Halorussus TaxID=1070314 RepID=UPI00209FE268|nr:helix-turn-helix domain-containing protein [Halorussus vallis]USZ75012.1 helix-turn-helix domain-containing protein [Halorussus vallis]
MGAGIHVEVELTGVDSCPVVSMSEDSEVTSVFTDRRPGPNGSQVVGELTVSADDERSSPECVSEVFSDATESVYRFSNEHGGCPCDRLPDHGCPVRDIHAASGALVVSFIVGDVEALKPIITDLRSRYSSVHVRRLTQSNADGREALLFVDRSAFTDRQFEVLQTAHEMGYFAQPKRADSADVAAELDISAATFSEHLAATQEKLLEQVFEQ